MHEKYIISKIHFMNIKNCLYYKWIYHFWMVFMTKLRENHNNKKEESHK